MTNLCTLLRTLRFMRDESGAAMVEFAMVVSVFFLMVFQIIDFGIFTSNNLMAEKSTQIATRVATVRPAACAGLPDRYAIGTASPAPRYGTSCGAVLNACAMPATVSCAGGAGNTTANEIWTRIAPTMPSGTTISDLTFIYSADPNLGYLGGPYVPLVTVELTLPAFQLSFPIGALANLAGGGSGGFSGQPQYRVFSITLPGEDLATGTNG
ncbi:MAG: Flp pilus assembly protein TadG [Reinekea sp.]|jgi:Flp pilus assembly protein TadG